MIGATNQAELTEMMLRNVDINPHMFRAAVRGTTGTVLRTRRLPDEVNDYFLFSSLLLPAALSF
jgi:hypothetical protein